MRMGLRRRALIAAVPTGRLPSAYQEVEYIANATTATQSIPAVYFDTGYLPSNNTDVYIKAYYLGASDGFPFYTAQNQSGTTKYYGVNIYNGTMLVRYGTKRGSANAAAVPGYNRLSEITVTNGQFTVVSGATPGDYPTSYASEVFQFTGGATLKLFATANGGSPSRMRLYSFKIWESGVLVADFVPCYRKSDDVIGLYDIVRQMFITQNGTGTMYKGDDV